MKMKLNKTIIVLVIFFFALSCKKKETSLEVTDNKSLISIKENISWVDSDIPKFIKQYIKSTNTSENPVLLHVIKQNYDTTRVIILELNLKCYPHYKFETPFVLFTEIDGKKVYFQSNIDELFKVNSYKEEPYACLDGVPQIWEILILRNKKIYNKFLTPLHNWDNVEEAEIKNIKH